MASSSNSSFEFDRAFKQAFDDTSQQFNQQFDQHFTNTFDDYESPEQVTKQRKKRIVIERRRESGHDQIMKDYFSDDNTYTDKLFRRRFRMNKPLFLRIVDRISNEISYFEQRRDATGRKGLSALQKCTAAIRLLAYGGPADRVDEYVRIGKSTALLCLENFVQAIIELFGDEYLRRPTRDDLTRLLHIGEMRGFPGMIGSIDCMHWEWKNCPYAWKGQYVRGSGKPTIVLEAVASQDLWIWHAFFGFPGTDNDLNVLEKSPVFNDILHGEAPNVTFSVNGNDYDLAYYLTDGIYPKWTTFIQCFRLPQSDKHKVFASYQEGCRKDVERAFGVLQARFAIIKNPALFHSKRKIENILRACVILHNMIVEDERDGYKQLTPDEFIQEGYNNSTVNDPVFSDIPTNVSNEMKANARRIRNKNKHEQLKNDLAENIWQIWFTKHSQNQN